MAKDGRVRFSRGHINQRCIKLAENGFLVNLGNGVYQVTDRAEKYLAEELDAETLEEIDKNGDSATA